MEETSHKSSVGDVIHVFLTVRSFPVCFWCTEVGVSKGRARLRFASTVFLCIARHPRSNIFFQLHTCVSNNLEVLVHSSAQSAISFSLCLSDNCLQISGHILSGLVVFGIFVGLPFIPFFLQEVLSVRSGILSFLSRHQRD